jgi:lipopolysaccharide export system protein LptA
MQSIVACLVALSLTFWCFVSTGAAQAASNSQNSGAAAKDAHTKITADSMRYEPDTRKITFFKHVAGVHPDFTMYAEKMEFYLSDDKAAKPANDNVAQSAAINTNKIDAGKVEKVISYTDVKILLPEGRIGTCDKAVYTVQSEILRMEGSEKAQAILTENDNKLSGDVVLFYLKENRSEAHGHVQANMISK